jgi:hypothetical protein
MPGGVPVDRPAAVMAEPRRAAALPSLLWRVAAAMRSQLLGRRHFVPPEDDHLRRDVGLPYRDELPQYWDFTRIDH